MTGMGRCSTAGTSVPAIVPRWRGDTNFMLMLGGTRVISQALDQTREALVAALGRVS